MTQKNIIQKYYQEGMRAFSDRELLDSIGISIPEEIEIGNILSDSFESLQKIKDVGEIKALRILALNEIFDRKIRFKKYNIQVISSTTVFNILKKIYAGKGIEEVWTFYLNRANKIISNELTFSGSISNTILDQRMIVKRALELNASAVIITHNHPSGNPIPSDADQKSTLKLQDALQFFDINLTDHIIYASYEKFYSFRDEGLL